MFQKGFAYAFHCRRHQLGHLRHLGFNAVGWLLGGSMSWLSRTVFIIVGLSSLCLIPGLFMAETKTAE